MCDFIFADRSEQFLGAYCFTSQWNKQVVVVHGIWRQGAGALGNLLDGQDKGHNESVQSQNLSKDKNEDHAHE